MLNLLPILPLGEWADSFVEWLTDTFSFIFDPIKTYLGNFMQFIISLLDLLHPFVFIIIVMILAYFIMNKKIVAPILVGIGLLFIYNQELWDQLLNTMTLVIISSLLSVIIGVPLGILMSRSDRFQAIMKPILDFMQTMPAFVYLIPAVAFFGIGMVPGVFASLIFAIPPTVRFTNLGIRQVPKALVEAADAFGSTGVQKLFKVELPMAKPTIMAGINQTVMLALSMVVTASMIGAPGLGRDVLSALQRADVGTGFVAGIGIVILAIIIDRLTQGANRKKN